VVEVVWGCCVHGNFGGMFAIDYAEEAVVGDEEVRVPFRVPDAGSNTRDHLSRNITSDLFLVRFQVPEILPASTLAWML